MKPLIILIILSYSFTLSAQPEMNSTKLMLGVQAKILDLSPVAIQVQWWHKKLIYSASITAWNGSFPKTKPPFKVYSNSNYGYSTDFNFQTISLNPGIGFILFQSKQFMTAVSLNHPIAYNTYKFTYHSEDNLLGSYEKQSQTNKLESAIEIEHMARYQLHKKLWITAGYYAGYVYTDNTVFSEFPSLNSYFVYTPGIGYGYPLYAAAYIGIQYAIYDNQK